MLPAWFEQVKQYSQQFGQHQVAMQSQIGAQTREIMRQHGDANLRAIQADGEMHMRQSVENANQVIDQIHQTGAISMENARQVQQNSSDNARRTGGYVGDHPVSFKYCGPNGAVLYQEYSPGSAWQRCQ